MESQIDGVGISSVRTFVDERGMVIKLDVPTFQVKDVYCTTVRKGAIKAWHGYWTKSLLWTVVSGVVRLGLFDNRPSSETYKVSDNIYLGVGSNFSVNVPPGVFNGFKGISDGEAIVLVQASEPFSEDGMIRKPYDFFEFDWEIHNG